ncbi:MAG: Mur ligase family protein [Sphaerochaetaceae bacterium]
MRVLIFGLGILGGGFASASYFLNRGHELTITDLRSEKELGEPLQILKQKGAKVVCSKHREIDFEWADLVIKNPAIDPNSPYLALAKNVSTDISFLLSSPLIENIKVVAVSGTKGKTTTVAAVTHILNESGHEALQFGNMGISGFTILEELELRKTNNLNFPEYLVCELSSWQIRDFYNSNREQKNFQFKLVALTSLFADHLNTYSDYQAYKDDKWLLLTSSKQRVIVPQDVMGEFENKKALKSIESFSGVDSVEQRFRPTWAICKSLALGSKQITKALNTFRGVPHRQEQLGIVGNLVFINDSSATIPEAVAFTSLNLVWPFHLICGGADKNLSVKGMAETLKNAQHIHLLDGTFTTDKLIPYLAENNISYSGPFKSMKAAFNSALKMALESTKIHRTVAVLLSPGAASFGLFSNEFDRGEQFRELYKKLSESSS